MGECIYEIGVPFEGGVPYNVQFFNGSTWKNIEQFTRGDKVLQYDGCGHAELVEPIKWRSCRTLKKPIDLSRKTEWGYEFPLFLYEGQEILFWEDDKQVLWSTLLLRDEVRLGKCRSGRYNLVGSCNLHDEIEVDTEDDIKYREGIRLARMINITAGEDIGKYIGNFQFSDLLNSLSAEGRMAFLITLGVYDKYKQWEKNKAIDVKMPLSGMVSQVVDLWNITVPENCAWADKASNTISFGIDPVITIPDYLPEGYFSEYEMKFGFIVPSHKLVLRSGGIVFVLGDMR